MSRRNRVAAVLAATLAAPFVGPLLDLTGQSPMAPAVPGVLVVSCLAGVSWALQQKGPNPDIPQEPGAKPESPGAPVNDGGETYLRIVQELTAAALRDPSSKTVKARAARAGAATALALYRATVPPESPLSASATVAARALTDMAVSGDVSAAVREAALAAASKLGLITPAG